MGLIFYLSSQTSNQSSQLSGGLIRRVLTFILPNADEAFLEDAVSGLQFLVRKGAHFSAYTVLGILSFCTLITYKPCLFLKTLGSIIIGVGYSVSDEYHQTFVSGRSGELRDVIIDSAGVALGVILSILIYGLARAIGKRKANKMRKKQYIELTEGLQQRLRKEQAKSEELTSQNQSLAKEISQLNLKLKEISAKLEDMGKKDEPTEENAIADEPTEEKKAINLPDEVEYGAKAIGKIVLSSAGYCNELTATPRENAKELVNLILGRTEVAKAEILSLSKAECDLQAKKSAMDREIIEAEDYFKSVMAQK